MLHIHEAVVHLLNLYCTLSDNITQLILISGTSKVTN